MKLAIEFHVDPSEVPMTTFPAGAGVNAINIRPDRQQFIIDVTCPNRDLVKLAAWSQATSPEHITVADLADFVETWSYSD